MIYCFIGPAATACLYCRDHQNLRWPWVFPHCSTVHLAAEVVQAPVVVPATAQVQAVVPVTVRGRGAGRAMAPARAVVPVTVQARGAGRGTAQVQAVVLVRGAVRAMAAAQAQELAAVAAVALGWIRI